MQSSSIKNYIDLLLLNELDGNDSHAYYLIRSLNDKLGNDYHIKDASIYNALKRLEKDELIQGRNNIVKKNGRRRYIYSINQKGSDKLLQLRLDWYVTKNTISNILRKGNKDDN